MIVLRQAVELLEHTDKKVYEIAEEVGYSSLSYFSTAFKKSF
ncbi:helix-turn-helix domain-containing protein, partial [Gemmiger formicilis]